MWRDRAPFDPRLHALLALLASGCATQPAQLAALVNGTPDSDPSIVAVIHTRESGSRQLCTGTVIAPRAVLTAKHCVFEDLGGSVWTAIPAARLSIVLGADVVGAPGDELAVTAITTTEGPYRDGAGAVGGDIAILTLASDLSATPLALAAVPPTSGSAIRIVGFGYTEAGAGGTLGTQHAGMASIVSVEDGTFTSEGAQWTCTGDSGGPAIDVASGRVIGVTSIGPRGCAVSSSIYTRLDRHRDMLEAAGVVAAEPDAAAPGADAAGLTLSDAGSGAPPTGGCSAAPGATRGATTTSVSLVLLVGAAWARRARARRAERNRGR